MEENKYIVFILGAGASYEFGPPIMKSFLSVATRRYFEQYAKSNSDDVLKRCYETFFAFRDEYLNSSWTFDRDWNNLEELYTQADLLRLAHIPDPDTANRQCEDIAWTIWDTYRKIGKTNSWLPPICDKIFTAGYTPVIITTNYDLLVERSIAEFNQDISENNRNLEQLGMYYPGFEFNSSRIVSEVSADTIGPKRHDRYVPIMKLHGSVNWFQFTGTATPEKSWVFSRSTDVQNTDITLAAIERNVRAAAKRPESEALTPGIIPPMLGKSLQAPVIAYQWGTAIQMIANARQMFIIGYSFPQTDTFMSRLLTEGLRKNTLLQQLAVVDVCNLGDHGIDKLLAPRIRSVFKYSQAPASEVFNRLSAVAKESWVNPAVL